MRGWKTWTVMVVVVIVIRKGCCTLCMCVFICVFGYVCALRCVVFIRKHTVATVYDSENALTLQDIRLKTRAL